MYAQGVWHVSRYLADFGRLHLDRGRYARPDYRDCHNRPFAASLTPARRRRVVAVPSAMPRKSARGLGRELLDHFLGRRVIGHLVQATGCSGGAIGHSRASAAFALAPESRRGSCRCRLCGSVRSPFRRDPQGSDFPGSIAKKRSPPGSRPAALGLRPEGRRGSSLTLPSPRGRGGRRGRRRQVSRGLLGLEYEHDALEHLVQTRAGEDADPFQQVGLVHGDEL